MGTTTSNYGFYKPADHESGYTSAHNANWDSVDALLVSSTGNVVNILDHGGVSGADNLTAFNAALAALVALGGGTLQLGPGDWWTSAAPNWFSGLTIQGAGKGNSTDDGPTVIRYTKTSGYLFAGTLERLVVRDLDIVVTSTTAAGAVNLQDSANGCYWDTFERVRFEGAGAAYGVGLLLSGQIAANSYHRFIACEWENFLFAHQMSGFANSNYFEDTVVARCGTAFDFEARGSDTSGGDTNTYVHTEVDGSTPVVLVIDDTANDNKFYRLNCDGATASGSIVSGTGTHFDNCILPTQFVVSNGQTFTWVNSSFDGDITHTTFLGSADRPTAIVNAPSLAWAAALKLNREFTLVADDCWFVPATALSSSPILDGGVLSAVSGTAAAVSLGTAGSFNPSSAPGILRCSTGTDTTGRAGLISAAQPFYCKSSLNAYCMVLAFGDVVSDGTNTYTVRAGFGDLATGEQANGVFFRYTHGTNSGKWQAVTRKAGTETATDTGVAFSNAFVRLEIIVSAATAAYFYLNSNLVATNSTNLPNTSSNIIGWFPGLIVKSAGTSAREWAVDAYKYALTLAR